MKHAIPISIALSFLAAGSAFAFEGYPQAERIEPRSAKVGSVLTISGRGLNKQAVDEVYLTDHRFDMKVKVIEQTEDYLKIRIPPFAKPGRLQLLLLTTGDKPAYLEQPIYVTVEEADAAEPAVVAPAPVITKHPQAKPVEIASIGPNIPVPPAASPNPAVTPAPVKREEVPVAPQQPVSVPVPQAAAPAPVAPANVTKGVTPPRLIKRTPVAMPAFSPGMGGDTTVELLVQVNAEGKVGQVKVLRGSPILGQAAARSVRDWVYESAYVGSTPVAAEVTVIMNFKR